MAEKSQEPPPATGDGDVVPNTLPHPKQIFQKKVEKTKAQKPVGGFDATPIPKAPPGFNVRIVFHRALHLPMADLNTLSSDPFIVAELKTRLPTRHKDDPPLRLRTPTIQKNVNPEWNAEWLLAGVPATGFRLKLRLYDEDPKDYDDRLGNVHVDVSSISEGWQGIKEQPFPIKKRMGSKRAYAIRGCATIFNRNVHMSGQVVVSVEVLGRTDDSGGRVYTIGPHYWSEHFSPIFGRFTGVKEPQTPSSEGKEKKEKKKKNGESVHKYNFQANQIQLRGPVPADLYHRYVEFKPFIHGLFARTGFRGRLLNRALHIQHARLYSYDRTTAYGCIRETDESLTLQFLDMAHYDEGYRTFTYVLTLDGQFRFTETGKEFGIDMLSKHSMHSDVSAYIACSGEFLVKRVKRHSKGSSRSPPTSPSAASPGAKSPDEIQNGEIEQEVGPPKDVHQYELIIDNDSGTYRPKGDLLPQLAEFLQANFPGLKVRTMACDDDKLQDIKKKQRELKKSSGQQIEYTQGNGSESSLSSIESDLDEQQAAAGGPKKTGLAGLEQKAKQRKAAAKQLIYEGGNAENEV